ncbi:hypothetical protein DFJ77DRAFT_459286 [Powellomyces hirtus]|nr:hypothetical protein DFJ77DRAFT_459286 [Powellomyces hirtus]
MSTMQSEECNLSVARKEELLKNLQLELDVRRRKYDEETEQLEELLLLRCQEAWMSLPPALRQMSIQEFVVDYAGDVNTWKELYARKMAGLTATQPVQTASQEAERPTRQPKSVLPSFSHLPQTPVPNNSHATQSDRDSISSISSTSSRRMTLRSHTRNGDAGESAPPTPRVAIPLRNGTVVCDFDPTQFSSVDDMRDELGDECDEAFEGLKAMHEQLSRLLGY